MEYYPFKARVLLQSCHPLHTISSAELCVNHIKEMAAKESVVLRHLCCVATYKKSVLFMSYKPNLRQEVLRVFDNPLFYQVV